MYNSDIFMKEGCVCFPDIGKLKKTFKHVLTFVFIMILTARNYISLNFLEIIPC